MSQPAQPAIPVTSHFDAAKVIVETLKGVPKDQQILAIRFACETLGLQTPVPAHAGAAAQQPPPSPGTPGAPVVPARSTDIKQFAAAKSPKSDQQFATVVAYFYRFEAPEAQRKESISADDLIEAARLVGRRRPHRITLNNAKSAGYLDAAGRGKFQINTVGENLVAVGLPGDGSDSANGMGSKRGKKPGTRRKAAKKKAKKKTP